jgi:uncharacterized protein YjcR
MDAAAPGCCNMRDIMDLERLKAMWAEGLPPAVIADRLGVTPGALWNARRKLGLPPRPRVAWNAGQERKIDVPLLFRLWHMGSRSMPVDEIANQLGVKKTTVYKAAQRHKLPLRERIVESKEYLPTPEEIAEKTREIRERHLRALREESEETTRKRVWNGELRCHPSSSQSRA